jgi:DNA primase
VKKIRFDFADYIERTMPVNNRKHMTTDKEYTVDCPNCGDQEHFDFSVSKQQGKCWKCDWGCNGIQFIMAAEGCDRATAMRIVLERAKIFGTATELDELKRIIQTAGVKFIPDPEIISNELPKECRPIFDKRTRKAQMPVYLKDRGIDLKTVMRFRLGLARYGRYAGRVIVPVVCAGVRSFVARDVTGMAPKKYLNPPESVYSHLLFDYDQNKGKETVTLVEGVFDVMRLWQSGVPACALFGKSLGDGQLALLLDSKIKKVRIMLDDDAYVKSMEVARTLGALFDVELIQLPPGRDPADLGKKEVQACMLKSRPAAGAELDYITDTLKNL